jgi:hypothetical protein
VNQGQTGGRTGARNFSSGDSPLLLDGKKEMAAREVAAAGKLRRKKDRDRRPASVKL